MGTCYTQADYNEIYNLVNKFDAGKLLSIPKPVVWTKENGNDTNFFPLNIQIRK